MESDFAALDAVVARPSIAPEKLLWGMRLQAFYSVQRAILRGTDPVGWAFTFAAAAYGSGYRN